MVSASVVFKHVLFLDFSSHICLPTLQAKESDSAPLISDSLSKVENGGGVVDDEPLKVPMWSSKYSRA